jgi:hypothetical protein
MRAAWLVLALVWHAVPAQAHVQRFALIVGNETGAPGQERLRYALNDATRMYEVLRELGGIEPADMVLLRNEPADVMRRSLISLNDRIRSARELPDTQVMLLVYYSGHGDSAGLRLSGSVLALAELTQLVRGSAADMRVLIVDACRSGSITESRAKGWRVVDPFPLPQDELPGSGLAYLTASSADEDAQESDQLQGSFFTHALVTALLGAGDSNGDFAISLDEAYRYAYEATLRATSQSLLGTQHPSFRYDLSGQGALTLSRLREHTAERCLIRFPDELAFMVLREDADGAIVADVRRSGQRLLSLPPGRYFVRARGEQVLYEGEVRALAGTSLALSLAGLRCIEGAHLVRLANKGDRAPTVAHKVELSGLVLTPLEAVTQPCLGGSVGYWLELAPVSLQVRIGACTSSSEPAPPRLASRLLAYRAELLAHRVWDFQNLALAVGIGAGVSLAQQRFETERDAPQRTAALPFVAISARAEWDLSRHWFVALEVAAETHFLRLQRERLDPALHHVSFVLAPALGLGVRL